MQAPRGIYLNLIKGTNKQGNKINDYINISTNSVVCRHHLPFPLNVIVFLYARIVHRDIKPSNFLLYKHSSGKTLVKVADFGISRVEHKDTSQASTYPAGTESFLAPEYCVEKGKKIVAVTVMMTLFMENRILNIFLNQQHNINCQHKIARCHKIKMLTLKPLFSEILKEETIS